jgi:hypothetical protein
VHHEVKVDAAALKGFVGRYQLAPKLVAEITFEDGRLYAQLTGQARYPVFMEGPHSIFWRIVEASADFELDGQGRATAMVLHQGGQTLRAARIEG